jgi:hypothetical protein
MHLIKPLLLVLFLLVRLRAGEPSVQFWMNHASETDRAEIDLFQGDACDLTWLARGLPNSSPTLKGEVFQAATTLALPLKDLNFEITSHIEPGKISTELKHKLSIPVSDRPLTLLVKWRTQPSLETSQNGNLLIRIFPHGLLADWPNVMISEQVELNAVHAAFTRNNVETSRLSKPQNEDWKGTYFIVAQGRELEALQKTPLSKDQCLIVFADLPGLRGSSLANPIGAGRLVVVPTSWITRFEKSPLIQKTIRELAISFR